MDIAFSPNWSFAEIRRDWFCSSYNFWLSLPLFLWNLILFPELVCLTSKKATQWLPPPGMPAQYNSIPFTGYPFYKDDWLAFNDSIWQKQWYVTPRFGYKRLWILSWVFSLTLSLGPRKWKPAAKLWVAWWKGPSGKELILPANSWKEPEALPSCFRLDLITSQKPHSSPNAIIPECRVSTYEFCEGTQMFSP